jgi:hypothetical protein
LRILSCSSLCWKQAFGTFLMLLVWYTLTLPTTDTQHFFAKYLFSFENKLWQFPI